MKTSTGLYSDNIVLELDNIRKLVSAFKNPQDSLKVIHIAGTNGKGSVCSFLQSTLTLAGFKVGKFSSPDIKTAYDAITVNGEDITAENLNELYESVKKAADGFSPSEFEILTCVAFLYFKEKNCDFVILETGLGGIGDATNIIASPVFSVITRISLDHTNFLGNTIEKIAEKKAGIIKKNGKTVTLFNQEADALKVISDKCKKENNTLILTKKPRIFSPSGIYENFRYLGLDITSGLSGLHQIENAALAIEVLHDLKIDEKLIQEGIKNAKNPARFELISENPPIIFDGAHNTDGIKALLSSLKRYYPDTKKTFIIGMMKDKLSEKIAELFKEYNEDKLSKILTVSVSNNPRSEKSENPPIIFDGAHNTDGIKALLSSLKRYYPDTKKTFIIGMMKDKLSEKITELFKEYNEDKLSKILTVSVSNNPRSEKSENLKVFFEENGFSAENAQTLKNALSKIKKDRLTVICGSLYMYRELF